MQEITHHVVVPELAFTGDTTAEFFTDPANEEVFKARLLIMECTFLDDAMTPENAKVRYTTQLLAVQWCLHAFPPVYIKPYTLKPCAYTLQTW